MLANDRSAASLLEGDREMVEFSLLLPGWQADALERVAADSGLTIGQLLRRLVNQAITQHDCAPSEPALLPASH